MLMLPNCCLPGGVMVDILSRLPVKSLLRFKSVCKPWYLLLTSPEFITMHLRQTNGDKLLTESDLLLNYNWYVVPALYVYNREDNTSFDLPLHLFPFSSRNCVKIVGSCNGLVCAQGIINRSPALVIWNPATRQFRYLDPHRNIWLLSSLFVGFGFVLDTNDYKVVVFQSNFKLPPVRIMVFVYTFSSDSWRLMEVAAPVSRFLSRAITLNGVFYWIERVLNKMEIIVSFDLRNEVFGQMKVPDSCCFDGETKCKLVVLKGSLSVIFYPKKEERDRSFEIWVMTELGVEESWTKLLTAGPFSGIVEPVGSWKNGELIFRCLKSRSSVLFSYDPCTLEIEYFAVPESRGLIRAFSHVESLEFVDGRNKRSSKRCTFAREHARMQIPCKNSMDLETPSNDFVSEFAIPGPKNSGLLHCRLCGEVFYHGDIRGLKLHLAHRNTGGSPCPYFSKKQYLAHRKSRTSPYVCVSADILMGKMRKGFRVLKEKLIKKRVEREKVAEHISLPLPPLRRFQPLPPPPRFLLPPPPRFSLPPLPRFPLPPDEDEESCDYNDDEFDDSPL